MSNVIVQLAEVPFDLLARRIQLGYERCKRSDEDWVEGSLEVAAAFREARTRFGTDHRRYGIWIKEQEANGLFHYDPMARAALTKFAADLDTFREILTAEPRARNYIILWRKHRRRYVEQVIYMQNLGGDNEIEPKRQRGRPKNPNIVPKAKSFTRRQISRKFKLGEDFDKIINTSLASAPEMDALISLKESFEDTAKDLIWRASHGEAVSAVAVCKEKAHAPLPTVQELTATFTHHSPKLLSVWLRATPEVRRDFIKHLEEIANG